MMIGLRIYWLALLLLSIGLTPLVAQPTLTLYYGDPAESPDKAFDGNVLQAGDQVGDAPIFAQFGGTGQKSFQIDSPGENKTITVDKDGFFFIRPTASTVIDQSKIKNFPGTVTGSVSITVRPLVITTLSANVTSNVTPGSDLLISYTTGSGTFPVDLAISGFAVNLVNAGGAVVTQLLSPVDQYSGREQKASSFGGTRTIKATIPASVGNGSYRVQVVTTGLTQNVLGSLSAPFTIANNNPSITPGSISSTACAGASVSFPFTISGGTFPMGTTFNVQLLNASGSLLQTLSGAATDAPVVATLPATLLTGTYFFRVISSTGITSNASALSVRELPTLVISGGATVSAGSVAPIQLTLTGTPPWTISYLDYTSATATIVRTGTAAGSPVTITPTFYATTTYSAAQISSFRDASGCGLSSNISGSALISVGQTTLTTGALSGTYCPGTTLSVSFTPSSGLPSSLTYLVQLSDASGNFQNAVTIGTGTNSPITAILPGQPDLSSNYRLQVIVQKPTISGTPDYSNLTTPVPTPLQIARPPAPLVSDVSFCPGTTLNPLTAVGQNLRWYLLGSTTVLPDAPKPPNDRSSVYQVSQTINGCESPRARIDVTQQEVPPAPAVSTVTVCQGGQIQFGTLIPGALWYTNATGGSGSAQPPNLNSQSAGEQTVYVSQTLNGCESPRAAVKAIVIAPPPAPGVSSVTVCQYAGANSLTALGANLTWYRASVPLSGAPTPDTSVPASLTYGVTQTLNGCQSSQATVTINVRAAPNPPTANSVRYCVGENPQPLTASGSGSTFRWYQSASGGLPSENSPAFFTQSPNEYMFYVSQVDASGCESLRQSVTVSVVSPPAAPTVTTQQVACQNSGVAPLTASPNTDLTWQGAGINGSTNIAPTPVTSQPATFTYLVTQRVGSCVSPAARITFTVNPQPDAPRVQSPVNFCLGNPAIPLSATAVGKLTWYVNADRSGTATTSILPAVNTAGNRLYYVTQRDGNNCESANSIVEVRVANRATARISGDDAIYLGDSTALRVRLTGEGPWNFTDWNGQSITTQDSLYVSWIRPKATNSYSISNLKSTCGLGDNGRPYQLTVRTPLAALPITEPLRVITYPNPTAGEFTVEWYSPTRQMITLQIVDATGRIIRQVTQQATGVLQTERFQLTQSSGMYYLQIVSINNALSTYTVIKK